MSEPDVVIGIGGAAGDGTASAGNTLVLSMARQGIAGYSYNSYQSVIRGGIPGCVCVSRPGNRSTRVTRSTW